MYENKVKIVGKVLKMLPSHVNFNIIYYEILIRVHRSIYEKYDDIPVIAPEWLIEDIEINGTVMVDGELRVYKNTVSTWQNKRIMIFAKTIKSANMCTPNINRVYLLGDIKRVLPMRYTPLSGRLISDFSIDILRLNSCIDTIFCIAWGINARKLNLLEAGDKVKITGRLQTRNFTKKHPDGTVTEETIHEVSTQSVDVIE